MKTLRPLSRQLNVERMRQIDFWVGVPLCALLTFWDKIVRVVLPSRSRPVRRILLIKLSEVGAVVQTYPLLIWLRKTYPDAEVSFLVFKKNISLLRVFEGNFIFHRIYGITDDSLLSFLKGTWDVLRQIVKEDFDVVIDLEFFSRFTAILSFLSGAERRVGFYRYSFEGLFRGGFLTHKVSYNPLLHCSKMYLALGKMLAYPHMDNPGMPVSVDSSEIVFPFIPPLLVETKLLQEKLERSGLIGKRLYLINPGEGILPLREWPLNNFNLLARNILARDPLNAVIIVGRSTSSGKDVLLHRMVDDPRCFNWFAETDMPLLFALFHRAEALVCNDGGLSHLASLTRLKTVVLFGPEAPQVFAPTGSGIRVISSDWPCSPCLSVLNHRVSSCRENFCLKAIPIEKVFSEVMS